MQKLMTLEEFKVDYSRETGVVDGDVLDVLYDRYCEAEAEAIAGGKYDVDPEIAREIQCAAWAKMNFQVRKGYVTYLPYTDAQSVASILVGGFNTRDEANNWVHAQYVGFGLDESNEKWFYILPEAPRDLPVALSLEECPF